MSIYEQITQVNSDDEIDDEGVVHDFFTELKNHESEKYKFGDFGFLLEFLTKNNPDDLLCIDQYKERNNPETRQYNTLPEVQNCMELNLAREVKRKVKLKLKAIVTDICAKKGLSKHESTAVLHFLNNLGATKYDKKTLLANNKTELEKQFREITKPVALKFRLTRSSISKIRATAFDIILNSGKYDFLNSPNKQVFFKKNTERKNNYFKIYTCAVGLDETVTNLKGLSESLEFLRKQMKNIILKELNKKKSFTKEYKELLKEDIKKELKTKKKTEKNSIEINGEELEEEIDKEASKRLESELRNDPQRALETIAELKAKSSTIYIILENLNELSNTDELAEIKDPNIGILMISDEKLKTVSLPSKTRDVKLFCLNKLEKIENFPTIVDGDVHLIDCENITEVSNVPKEVSSSFVIDSCGKIEKLALPEKIGKDLNLQKLTNLDHFENFPTLIGNALILCDLSKLSNVNGIEKITSDPGRLIFNELKEVTPGPDIDILNNDAIKHIRFPDKVNNLSLRTLGKLEEIENLPKEINGNVTLYELPKIKKINVPHCTVGGNVKIKRLNSIIESEEIDDKNLKERVLEIEQDLKEKILELEQKQKNISSEKLYQLKQKQKNISSEQLYQLVDEIASNFDKYNIDMEKLSKDYLNVLDLGNMIVKKGCVYFRTNLRLKTLIVPANLNCLIASFSPNLEEIADFKETKYLEELTVMNVPKLENVSFDKHIDRVHTIVIVNTGLRNVDFLKKFDKMGKKNTPYVISLENVGRTRYSDNPQAGKNFLCIQKNKLISGDIYIPENAEEVQLFNNPLINGIDFNWNEIFKTIKIKNNSNLTSIKKLNQDFSDKMSSYLKDRNTIKNNASSSYQLYYDDDDIHI